MSVKRLFLFAGYDPNGRIDSSLVYYVRALSALGDVVVHMDCDSTDNSIQRLAPYTVHAAATRHGEYDFGSYKRAYIWACENLNINDYDFVYMVNDSVYGPLYDLGPFLEKMESNAWDAFGPVCNPKTAHPHIQSWFIGMRPSVFKSDWFATFITSVRPQADKGTITKLYEQGFTTAVAAHGAAWGCIYTVANRGVYNKIKSLYRRGLPFMKKVAFTRHGGRLGHQILYVLNHIPTEARSAILENARRTWGAEYMDWLLTNNPFKITIRAIKYGLNKARKGQL
ncbi:MAG: rhamnan synthesis F family protein [Alphaproteobacteria bacterium]|nr:rhamnan synthesis F family protein [Alphaproteobacteria bacterium]